MQHSWYNSTLFYQQGKPIYKIYTVAPFERTKAVAMQFDKTDPQRIVFDFFDFEMRAVNIDKIVVPVGTNTAFDGYFSATI